MITTGINNDIFDRWLLHDPHMKLRTTHPPFLAAVERYFDRLFPILTPLQVS